MKSKRFLLILLVLTLTMACNLPMGSVPQSTPEGIAKWLVTQDPNAPPTPTPFMPEDPTPIDPNGIPTAEGTPFIEPTVDPNVSPTSPAPTQTPYIDGQVRIMVLGSDWRPSSGSRTDVMMLFSINPKEGTATVLSFPRDLYVYIPGWGGYDRINTAMGYGDFSMLADTLEYNFGVRPDHYIITNFQGFVGIIDSLNGIYVNVGAYLTDHCDLPQAVDGYCTVSPGMTLMDGTTALWYVRSRYSSSDLDRTRRAQEVMMGLFTRLMSFDAVLHIPDLYDRYKSSVETTLGLADILPLVPVATQLLNDTSRIRRYAIGYSEITPYVVPETGAQVLLPNYDLIHEIIQQAVFTP
jgi:polyisoprenyl-teichoic acid--peptidoglycan teichoic acid transferase